MTSVGDRNDGVEASVVCVDGAGTEKLSYVADIETIQTQLAKPSPSKAIVQAAWAAVKGAATIDGCASLVGKLAGHRWTIDPCR